ncbi:MAG TPA: integrase arm-type DNA-binding domain-containing protein [Aestuariivirga sp.]|nr:integrase arm-type DNA-binding domain-containing protein [Aestuariivirga sp.]
MAREVGLLNARKAETLSKLGRHADGGNLYLSISENGGRRWVFLYRLKGSRKEMGLGSAAKGHVSLAEARKAAAEARSLIANGEDPLAAKEARKQAARTIPTFGAFADDYIASHRSKFRNEQHIYQWEMTLKIYCQPIRSMLLNEIDTEAVLKVLQPIWARIPETASRLRGRIENVLDAAKAKGYRIGENPAQWRGHLKTLLPARQRLTRGHHAALPYDDLPVFITDLRSKQTTSALALELCILTATRSGEILNAQWQEFDLKKAIWTIPAIRMKAGHEHRIPLTARALVILKSLHKLPHSDHVFPGNARHKFLSPKVMLMLLKRMGRTGITIHGFRSTFRDWASEQTSFPHETCEHALAHRISDKAEAAYRRGDQFEKRRKLMEAWGAFCEPRRSAKVVQLKKQKFPQ